MSVPGRTLVEVFSNRVARSPDKVAMRYKAEGEWKPITYAEFARRAREVANGLLSLGVGKDACVSLLSKNRPEWHISDAGMLLAGVHTVPIYATNSPPQVGYVISHSESKVAIVEDRDQLEKVLKVKSDLPMLEKVVVMTGEGGGEDGLVISFDELGALGRGYEEANPKTLDEGIAAIRPEDVATIVYTSGTTGPPKGVLLTHDNFVRTLEAGIKLLGVGEGVDRLISYLPLSHIFERLIGGWGTVYFGGEVWYAESVEKVVENLKDCRPTIFVGVPRVYEKFYAGVKAQVAKHPKRELIEKAIDAGLRKVELQQAGKPMPLALKAKYGLLNKLVLSKLRHGLGMDACRIAITGAAPIEPEVIKFIHALGIELVEGYGLTETTAPVAANPPGRVRIGTVGPPLNGVEVKIDEDGEILVRGYNVFKGYFKSDQATADAFTADGFFRTGDVGEFDPAGYLKITDRKKDLIITAGGKNVAPQEIENRLKFDPMISQALVIGDRRPYLTALLTLDPEIAPKWAEEHGMEFTDVVDLAEHPKVLEAAQAVVDRVNEGLAQVERVKKWTLLPRDFTQDADEITPTLKVRRKTVSERYADVIERMYA